MTDQTQEEIRLIGISGSPGICIGKAYIVDKKGAELVNRYSIEKKNLKNEIKRFKAAVKKAKDQLLEVIDSTPDELKQHAYVFETHLQSEFQCQLSIGTILVSGIPVDRDPIFYGSR